MEENPLYNEKELLTQMTAGDEAAFKIVYDRYRNKVFTIAVKMLGIEAEAMDALQEVFIKIWLHREKLTGVDNFNAYLNAITRNHLYNLLRRKAYEESLVTQLAMAPGEATQAGDRIDLQALRKQLLTAIHTLPQQQRRVFELSKLEGMKQEEIAAFLGISRETVKKHLAAAMQNLRNRLGGQEALVLLLLISFHH